MKEFVSYSDHRARFLDTKELLKRKPSRVISAKEMDDGDLEIWLQGTDKAGAFHGCIRWSDIQKRPLGAAWLQRYDYATVMNMFWRQKRRRKS